MLNLKRIFFLSFFFIFFLFLTPLLVSCMVGVITETIEPPKLLTFSFASDSVKDSLYESSIIHDLGDTLILYAEITEEVEDADFKAALDSFDLFLIDSNENIVTSHLHHITDAADSAFETDFFIGRFTVDTVGVFKLQAISRTSENAFLDDIAAIELRTGIKPVIDDSISNLSDDTITVGGRIYFKVHVSKGTDPEYQWYKDDVLLNDVGNVLLIEDVKDTHSGSYQCSVSNDWGTVSSKAIKVQIIENKAPVWDSTKLNTKIEVSEGDPVNINFNEYCEDPEGDSLVFSLVGTPSLSDTISLSDAISNSLFSYATTFDDSGQHTLKVEVSDLTLTDTADFTIQVKNVNRPPVWNSLYLIPSPKEYKQLKYPMKDHVVDPDGDDIEIILDSTIHDGNKIEHPQIDNDVLLIEENSLQVGFYRFYLSAADDSGTSSKEFILIVSNNENLPPLWDTVSVIPAIDENDSLQFYVGDLVTDPDCDTLKISLDSTYWGEEKTEVASIHGDTLKMSTDYSSAGNYTFYLTARDCGFLSAQHELTLTVNNVNQAPKWKGATIIPAIDENNPLAFYFGGLVTDPDGEVLTISLDSTVFDTKIIENPAITGNTLKLPANYHSAGNYDFYFSASDGTDSTTRTFNLTVYNVVQTKFLAVKAGTRHTLILDNNNALWATGGNSHGQLGDGSRENRLTPVYIKDSVKEISVGYEHTLIIRNDNTLWATGENVYGQLGNDTYADETTFINIMSDIKAVSAGYHYSLILKQDNTFLAKGNNDYGQLGDSSSSKTNVKAVFTGRSHSFILNNDNTLEGTGWNKYGQLGVDDNEDKKKFVSVSIRGDIKTVAAGYGHSLILTIDGSLYATGFNNRGQLGMGIKDSNTNTLVFIKDDIKAVSAGDGFLLFLNNGDSLYAAGANNYGQLGIDTTALDIVERVFIMDNVKAISAGRYHSFIIKNDSTLWGTGDNSSGQLGDGTTVNKNSFVQITF